MGLAISNPECPRCPYRPECATVMGHLADRVNVDETRFRLLPPPYDLDIDHSTHADPDLAKIDKVYTFCHEWVFDSKPIDRLPKDRGILLSLIREADVSIKLYFLTNMVAWDTTNHTLPFRARALTGPFAVKQVKTYAKACQERFGVFNLASLDQAAHTHLADQDFETRLRNTEVIVGSWITAYKLTNSGELAAKLYAAKEIELDPYWLAIEDTYFRLILHPWINGSLDRNIDEDLRRHRFHAVRIHSQLKREKGRAILIFISRERIMGEAIRRVLSLSGYEPNDFKIRRDTTVTQPLKFWAWLGVAMQQIELDCHLSNENSVYA